MSQKITGPVHHIGEVQIVTDKFQKRDLVVEFAENLSSDYKEYIKIEFHQDKCDLLDEFEVGQQVEVQFNLKGKPFTNKAGVKAYYNNLVGWKIAAINGASAPASYNQATAQANVASSDADDDLPF